MPASCPALTKLAGQGMHRTGDFADMQWAAGAMPGAGAQRVILHALVDRQDVAPSPARIALRLPIVEIARLAAGIDHGVDRARPAQNLAAGKVVVAAAQTRNRLALIHPVHAAVIEGLAVADRQLDPESPVRGPGLEQQDATAATLREPGSDHRAGGPGADDDVVEDIHGFYQSIVNLRRRVSPDWRTFGPNGGGRSRTTARREL